MNLKQFKFWKLPPHHRSVSFQALPLVVEVRWRLWRTPFPVLHAQWRAQVQGELEAALTRGLARDESGEPDQQQINEVWESAHAVRRVARLVPFASCLTQAMALQLLLARSGHHCSVCIGVNRNSAAAPQNGGAAPESGGAAPSEGVGSPDSLANGSDLADGQFRAHAWVNWRGRVVIGGDVSRWKPLTIFAPVKAPISAPSLLGENSNR